MIKLKSIIEGGNLLRDNLLVISFKLDAVDDRNAAEKIESSQKMIFDSFECGFVSLQLLAPEFSCVSDQFRKVVHESIRDYSRVQENTQGFEPL